MDTQCTHITIDEATDLLKKRMKVVGFKEIIMEDDDPDYKNFFARSDRLFEGSFFCMQMALFALFHKDNSGAGMEFHVSFFTQKGRKIQGSLGKNRFERLRRFLDQEIFEPAGLRAVEYDPPNPSDRDYARPKRSPGFFPGHVPGVEIHVGGWLCKG